MLIVPAPRRQRQEDLRFKASPAKLMRPYLKNKYINVKSLLATKTQEYNFSF
jgi:hypothetical protein